MQPQLPRAFRMIKSDEPVFVSVNTVSTTSPSLMVPKSCDNLSNVIAGASVVDASAPTVALSLAFGFFDESVEHALRSIAKNKICKN